VRLNTEAHAAQPTIEFTAPEESTITSLAVIETTSAALVYAPGALTALVDKLKQEVRGQLATLDVSIPSQRARIISLSARVASAKVKLDKLGDSLIEEHRAVVTAVNADRKAMRDDLDAFKVEVRKPVTDLENAETARKAAHEAALAAIPEAEGYGASESVTELEQRFTFLMNYPARDWQEFSTRARNVLMEEIHRTDVLLVRAKKREADALELILLRAEAAERAIKEREEAAAKAAQEAAERRAEEQARIAREAAERERRRIENERIEAEARAKQAEAERIAAEQKAERDLKEAAHRAVLAAQEAADSERRAIAKERQRLADQQAEAARAAAAAEVRRIRDAEHAEAARKDAEKLAEQDRLQAAAKAKRDQEAAVEAERQRVAAQKKADMDEAEKRAKNRAHRLKIDNEALGAIVALDIPMDRAQDLLIAIAKGAVPHVTIEY
jgi:hypothetical protein